MLEMTLGPAAIADNLAVLRERMARAATRAGRHPCEITLVAVSKTFPAEAIREASAAGVRHFGENRVQELETKQPHLVSLAATWHLVGHLQSNKARRAVRLFDAVDSLDSLELARRLAAALEDEVAAGASPARRLRVLLEVRLAPEETKSGIAPDALEALARGILELPRLDLAGLMCIPPFGEASEQSRPYFRRLRELRGALRAALAEHPAARAGATRADAFLPVLSMGMSHDFEPAIEEGATEIRIGTALFGSRSREHPMSFAI
jgi:pyridoxal phosphate enzyme (YggS family)